MMSVCSSSSLDGLGRMAALRSVLRSYSSSPLFHSELASMRSATQGRDDEY